MNNAYRHLDRSFFFHLQDMNYAYLHLDKNISFHLLGMSNVCHPQGSLDENSFFASKDPHVPVSYTHLTLPTILLVQISVVAVSLKKKKDRLYQHYSQYIKTSTIC
eukprot:TRINITY_DN4992_c0_g1_i4.p2 TRINITY_DN4992_c0_g1~~TRINITY_DN4992_c0_g1_i4.p2  ORF type:complete len:106 (+),score=20.24 TRINITY_DN4992_c0_g1_i4:121-438(+)